MNTTANNEKPKSTYYLNGISCANCAAKIEDAIHEDSRFKDISFSFATKKLNLSSVVDGTQTQAILQEIVDSIEEGVEVDASSSVADDRQSHEDSFDSGLLGKLLGVLSQYRWVSVGVLIVLSLVVFRPSSSIALPGYVAAYLLIGGPVVGRAFKNLLRGNLFDEYFLMSLATFGAFGLGEWTEAVMVMLFYRVGEGFQSYAVDNSRRSIKSLLNIKAEYANLLQEGAFKKVLPETLKVDDRIWIRAGEKVPVDGVVEEGETTLDTSALTGESMPRRLEPGDEVLSGSINRDGLIKVKVTKPYEHSTVARILELVENASGKKAKTEQFITKFAKVYTPLVVLAATLLAAVPPFLGFGDFREWLSRALIFLVISCPCALVLSVPLGYFGGLGMASRKGILIKGGNYLEALITVDAFVFDKTGTLTKGSFSVQSVTGDMTLKLAAHLEQHSNHPIARSIVTAYEGKIDSDAVTDIREIAGEGLMGVYDEQSLLVGNSRLMNRYGIKTNEFDATETVVHVALDGTYVGVICIADELKPGVTELAGSLREVGAKTVVMLTGDQHQIGEHVAKRLGFDGFYCELLPQDKLIHVEDLIGQGYKVLFAGDGINDAPVLARAHIGVAMGGFGSDAAIEAADIVLMTDEPSKLLEGIGIARRTRNIVLQNILFALLVKVFFLSLGAMGLATMYEAIFADVGVSVLAVMNAMRVLRD